MRPVLEGRNLHNRTRYWKANYNLGEGVGDTRSLFQMAYMFGLCFVANAGAIAEKYGMLVAIVSLMIAGLGFVVHHPMAGILMGIGINLFLILVAPVLATIWVLFVLNDSTHDVENEKTNKE